jgi:hypothetical protein
VVENIQEAVEVDKAKFLADLLHTVLLPVCQALRSPLVLILALVNRLSLLHLTMAVAVKVPLVPLEGFLVVKLMATTTTWLIRV